MPRRRGSRSRHFPIHISLSISAFIEFYFSRPTPQHRAIAGRRPARSRGADDGEIGGGGRSRQRGAVRGDGGARERRDRKSVVEGKGVAVSVDVGGRRLIKKKKTK